MTFLWRLIPWSSLSFQNSLPERRLNMDLFLIWHHRIIIFSLILYDRAHNIWSTSRHWIFKLNWLLRRFKSVCWCILLNLIFLVDILLFVHFQILVNPLLFIIGAIVYSNLNIVLWLYFNYFFAHYFSNSFFWFPFTVLRVVFSFVVVLRISIIIVFLDSCLPEFWISFLLSNGWSSPARRHRISSAKAFFAFLV